jgi:hypothetical protein
LGERLAALHVGLGRGDCLSGTDHAKKRNADRILHREARQTLFGARMDDAGFGLVNRSATKSEVNRLPRQKTTGRASPDCLR